jgi:uncharacterized protein (TIGR00251 family)
VIELETHPDGTILPVKAHAGARRNGIGRIQAGALQVSVTQAPEKGKANKAIIAVLAEELGVKKSQIELIAGEASQQKRFLVRGVAKELLAERIVVALRYYD